VEERLIESIREGSSSNSAGTITTKTPNDNYYPKLICRGGEPLDTWKIDDNLELCKCLEIKSKLKI